MSSIKFTTLQNPVYLLDSGKESDIQMFLERSYNDSDYYNIVDDVDIPPPLPNNVD